MESHGIDGNTWKSGIHVWSGVDGRRVLALLAEWSLPGTRPARFSFAKHVKQVCSRGGRRGRERKKDRREVSIRPINPGWPKTPFSHPERDKKPSVRTRLELADPTTLSRRKRCNLCTERSDTRLRAHTPPSTHARARATIAPREGGRGVPDGR